MYEDGIILVRSAFLFVQGILAGFAFTSIGQETSAGNDASFIINYQPNANEYRRLFYLFTSISLVGSLDTLMTIISNQVGLGQAGVKMNKMNSENVDGGHSDSFLASLCQALSAQGGFTVFVAILIALLHGIAFLSTIIMSRVDILIAVRGGAGQSVDPQVWAEALLSLRGFSNDLHDWKTLDLVRLVTSILAWLGICWLSWKALSAGGAKNDEINRLKEALLEWQKRVNELEGNGGLEALNVTALRRLVALQQIGLDRGQNALKSLMSVNKEPL